MLGSSLLLERDLEGRLYVNGKQVITRDVTATNGVLHVIDGVLIPENARSFSQLLSSRNLTDFRRLVEAAGLITELDSMTNTTLFAPSNDAVRAIPDEVKQAWMADPQVLKKVILNHVSQPLVRQSAVSNNQMVRTRLDGNQLRINLYPSVSTPYSVFSPFSIPLDTVRFTDSVHIALPFLLSSNEGYLGYNGFVTMDCLL